MPATAKLTKWGNSLGIRIPKQIVAAHNFKDGEILSLEETQSGFVAEKKLRVRRYDPEKLFAGLENFPKDEIVDWGKPVGREVW